MEPAAPALRPAPVAAVRQVRPYRVPAFPGPIDLRLDGNEGAPPCAAAVEALVLPGEVLRRYPRAQELEADIATRAGRDPDGVFLAAGADEVLDRCCRAFLGPGRVFVQAEPGFEMLPRYAALASAEIRSVRWEDGPYPVEEVLRAVAGRRGLVAVVSPNNPTGLTVAAADLVRLAQALPQCLVVLDQAYADFHEGEESSAAARGLPNVVVVRSLSKSAGLAGIRVGYALGDPEWILALRRAGSPYPVSAPSLAAAGAWLQRSDVELPQRVAAARQEREELRRCLEDLGAAPLDGCGNFVFARFLDAAWVRDGLGGLGIAVRAFPGRPGLEDALRIGLPGAPRALERLLAGLRAVLRPQALLLDLDGVLADVSGSYRAAILATAADYGVALDPGEVARAKAAGRANDDWALTRRLLSAHGVDRPLAEVTARFEEHYRGSEARSGLRERERLLLTVEEVRRLAGRLPLAVVTGRPRGDAEDFLGRFGLRRFFAAVVCREDAPLKPDPAPVVRALEVLGVEAAWMVGDTPDDVSAARAAGVVPVGVVPPGEGPEVTRAALGAAGAARVLDRTAAIGDLLP